MADGLAEVNYHTLADFRVEKQLELDELFTQVLAALSREGLITLEQVMQDGTKIKALASRRSYRQEATIREHLERARSGWQRWAILGTTRAVRRQSKRSPCATPATRAAGECARRVTEVAACADRVVERFGAAHPLGGVDTVEEIAELAAFLFSNRSTFCTGGDYLVDGGLLAGIGLQ